MNDIRVCSALLPLLDFLPGLLVDGVVDGDYALHVGGLGVKVLALHGIKEHLFRGVYPVSTLGIGVGLVLIVSGSVCTGCLREIGGELSARDGGNLAEVVK